MQRWLSPTADMPLTWLGGNCHKRPPALQESLGGPVKIYDQGIAQQREVIVDYLSISSRTRRCDDRLGLSARCANKIYCSAQMTRFERTDADEVRELRRGGSALGRVRGGRPSAGA